MIAQSLAAVTPSDSVGIGLAVALWVGTAGDLKITDGTGKSTTFKNVGVGFFTETTVTKVWATGTTATDIVALLNPGPAADNGGWSGVTPSNSVALPPGVDALWVGVGGNIKVSGGDGVAAILKNVPVGLFAGVAITKIWATSTTATNISAGIGTGIVIGPSSASSTNFSALASLAGPNAFTGVDTFAGETDFNGPFVLGHQSFAQNGGAIGTVSATGAPVIEITGSGGGTLLMPAAPTVNLTYWIEYAASTSFTLDGNGALIDGASTQTITTSRSIRWNGSAWISLELTRALASTLYGSLASANTWLGANNFSTGSTSFGLPLVMAYQAFTESASGTNTISASAGGFVEVTGSGSSYTLNLPASPTAGLLFWITNSAANSLTLAGNGHNVAGAASVSLSGNGALCVAYNGAAWVCLGFNPAASQTLSGTYTLSGTVTFNGIATFSTRFVRSSQSFAATGTISAIAGSVVLYTGAGGVTINLPTASLVSGMQLAVKDASGNGVTVGRNGKTIDGAAADKVLAAYEAAIFWYDGTNWLTL